MQCRNCDSDQFDEWNGVLWCRMCNTQSVTVVTAAEDRAFDISKSIAKKVSERRRKRTVQQESGVLWTTTQAFNLILCKQFDAICHLVADEGLARLTTASMLPVRKLVRLVWLAYLTKSELAFHRPHTYQCFPLHPDSRFRDLQILRFKVESLPAFKNAMSGQRSRNFFKLGTDGLMKFTEHSGLSDKMQWTPDDELLASHSSDLFGNHYRDPRTYLKSRAMRQTEQILLDSMTDLDLEPPSDGNLIRIEQVDQVDQDQDILSNVNLTDYQRQLVDNSPAMTKSILEQRDRSGRLLVARWKESSQKKWINFHNIYYMTLMSLPKTLAVINIAFRTHKLDVYCFDLIRWAAEGLIPYKYCFPCLPEDWLFIQNDFHVFSSCRGPSASNLNTLSVRLANHIGITRYPRPDLTKLLHRLVKDLNLPKDFAWLIESEYNLFDRLELDSDDGQRVPLYERWLLMAVVALLRRLFECCPQTDRPLDDSSDATIELFDWNKWLKYTRLRLDLIRSYFSPLCPGDLEEIRDIDLLTKISLERTRQLETRTFGLNKSTSYYKDSDHLKGVQGFLSRLAHCPPPDSESVPSVKGSLYPLTNATNYALTRVGSVELSQKMSIDFYGSSRVGGWLCPHRKPFHRRYRFVDKQQTNWSSSLRLVMQLSCFMLNCKIKDLIDILICVEMSFFAKVRPKCKNKRFIVG